MITTDKKVVQLLVEQCVSNGMKHVVCSPGSRNAPLVIAFDEHPDVECLVIHDERSAAFFALGMAQQLRAPVGVLCTSGSAAANYLPAVTEAYYQSLPLIVITADRPAAWTDQGDGQTIVQRGLFGAHVRYSCDFTEKLDDAEGLWYVGRELAVGFSEANGYWKGPLHINIGLNEPLYGTVKRTEIETRQIHLEKGKFELSSAQAQRISDTIEGAKIMVLCGQHEPDPLFAKELQAFADNSSVAVLVENTANVSDLRYLHCIDRTLNAIADEEIEQFKPDLLISTGGAVISKRIKAFLRKNRPKQHWKIGHEFPYMDTYQSLTHSFQCDAGTFFREVNKLSFKRSQHNFGAKWKQKDFLVQERMPAFFQSVEYSDIKVFETLLDFLPEGSTLHMANSSVIRYCQLFDPLRSVKYFSNRGTSGIDGSTSTAAGAAFVKKEELNVLITGDVSFFYDSNAMWNAYLGSNLRIILINNQGGGIFRIIPGPSSTGQIEKYFEAQHEQEANDLCKAFGIQYTRVETIEEVEGAMHEFYSYEENGRPKLLEIITPRERNSHCLDDFFQALKM